MTTADDARPTVIVHMTGSVDGRIQTRRWGGFEAGEAYEEVHRTLGGNAWMCGRVTMQGYTRGQPTDDGDPTPVARTPHVARRDASGYAIALDPRGRLHWGTRNAIDDDHVVVVLSEAVSDAHLNTLRAAGISYLFGGRETIDLVVVARTLRALFGIERLLVEGGGAINGSFLAAGIVDEISLLLAPVVDGGRGIPAVFDRNDGPLASIPTLTLLSCTPRPDGIVHLRYGVEYQSGSA